jgi:8-oxo-dGTP diphosphatase
MAYTYKHPRPSVTVENLILSFENKDLKLLLFQRDHETFLGEWALPGGYVEINESLEQAAYRHLRLQTGLVDAYIEQFHTFGEVDRDPRGRTISITYYALVNSDDMQLVPPDDDTMADWFSVYDLPELAFDHLEIVEYAMERLREKLKYEPIGFNLLPRDFTLSDLQVLVETITEQELDKRNFRKKILNLDILEQSAVKKTKNNKTLATLYRFNYGKFKKVKEESGKLTLF